MGLIKKLFWALLSGIADESALQPWRVIGGGGGTAYVEAFFGTNAGSIDA